MHDELTRESTPVRASLVLGPLGPQLGVAVRVVGDVTDAELTLAILNADGHEMRVIMPPAAAAYVAGSLAARAGVVLGATV